MRSRSTLVLAALLAISCGGKKDDAPADDTTAGEAVASNKEPPAAKVAAPTTLKPKRARLKPKKLTRAERKQFNQRLREGRALQKKDKWSEATAALEQAVALQPTSGRALSELSWSAFKAGKLDRAAEAAAESVVYAVDPRVKAASLYNLGRVHEKRSHADRAITAYERSLRLRPNKVVKKRLLALGGEVPTLVYTPSCAAFQSTKKLCDCLLGDVGMDDVEFPETSGRFTNSCAPVGKQTAGLQQLSVSADDNSRGRAVVQDFLTRVKGDTRAVVAYLGRGFESHKFNSTVEMTNVEEQTLSGRRIVRVTVKRIAGTDEEYAAAANGIIEKTTEESLLLCVEVEGFLKCPVDVLRSYAYSATLVKDPEDNPANVLESFELQFKQKPPVKRGFELNVSIKPDGTVEVTHASGDKSPESKRQLKTYSLW